MYQEYKDIVEFRIVYISEAHAIDDPWPNPFAELKGIYEHKDYGQRCSTAEMMMQEENINIPCIIDDMDNNVGDAYKHYRIGCMWFGKMAGWLSPQTEVPGVSGRRLKKHGFGWQSIENSSKTNI